MPRYEARNQNPTAQSEMMRLLDECVRLGKDNDRLREALMWLHKWGGTAGAWDSGIVFRLNDWIEAGMTGELPELPAHAKTPNEES